MKKTILAITWIALASSAPGAVLIGLDAGYMIDSQEEYLATRFAIVTEPAEMKTHALEFEFGYAEAEELGVKAEIMPLTINYRFAHEPESGWGYSFGVGIGQARVKASGFGASFSDNPLAWQAFAGVTYHHSSSFAWQIGAKYLRIGDADLGGVTVELDDDVILSIGLKYRF